jgi:hypothetical protein
MPHEGAYDYRTEVASPLAPYMTLAAAMVEAAVEDVTTARNYIEGNPYWREDADKVSQGKRAWHWLTMPHDGIRGISFAFLCDAMGVDLDHAQEKLIDGVPDRVIDILERQIVQKPQKVLKKQTPKERKDAGANATKGRGNPNRRRKGDGRRNRRRPGAAGN